MKKYKVKAIIQNPYTVKSSYTQYLASLAKDLQVKLHLQTLLPRYKNELQPVAILGEGLSQIKTEVSYLEQKYSRLIELQRITAEIRQDYLDVRCSDIVHFEDEQYRNNDTKQYLFNIICPHNSSQLSNILLGTRETRFVKDSQVPTLVLPKTPHYSKPKTLLFLINTIAKFDIRPFDELLQFLNARAVLATIGEENSINLRYTHQNLDLQNVLYAGNIANLVRRYTNDHLDKIISAEKPEWIVYCNFDKDWKSRLFDESMHSLLLSIDSPSLFL